MISIEKILCPVDLSLHSGKALRYASALARAYETNLFVCYCTEQVAHAEAGTNSNQREDVQEINQRRVASYVKTANIEMPAYDSIVVESHDPAESIMREAAMRGVGLIVMCSRRRPLRAALLGSTVESVYRAAPCPVLVTHPDQREWVNEAGEVSLKRILIPYDFSDHSELSLRYALSLAQEYQADIHLLHVMSKPISVEPELAWSNASFDMAYHETTRKLMNAVPSEVALWCKVKSAVHWGKPYREILSYAQENEIDLICMGSQGAGFGMHALLGSNVDRVLRQANCPVLVARPLRPAMSIETQKNYWIK